jgi:hypothetical protein
VAASIRVGALEELSGVPDCWYGMDSDAKQILDTLNAAHDRPLTDKDRYLLQHDLEYLSSIALMTQDACAKAGLFLSPDEFEKQRELASKELREEVDVLLARRA